MNHALYPVQYRTQIYEFCSKVFGDTLHSQTNSEDAFFVLPAGNEFRHYSGLRGQSWPGRKNNFVEFAANFGAGGIVFHYDSFVEVSPEVVIQVVGEGIVIIENQQPHGLRILAQNNAITMKTIYETIHAPAPIGPYSQATGLGQFVFVSGQIAINPENGTFCNGSVAEEAEQVMKNLLAVLHSAGSSVDKILKTSIFLMDMADFPVVNEIYSRHFSGQFPARETVQVAGLPKGARVEISAIAYV